MEARVVPPNFNAQKRLFSIACEQTLRRGEGKITGEITGGYQGKNSA